MYEYGQGIPQDYQKAIEYFQKCANQGNQFGQHNLGMTMFIHSLSQQINN